MSDWKGADEDLPNFGDRARRWFRLSVKQRAADLLKRDETRGYTKLPCDRVSKIINEICDHPFRYVYCLPKPDYNGGAYSYYSWEVAVDVLDRALRTLVEEARLATAQEEYARAFPTLDAWLRADMQGSLPSWYHPTSGSKHLPTRVRAELRATALERRRKWPLVCRNCGTDFIRARGSRGQPLYCADCAKSRAQ